jgi:hypothetical protein
MIRRLMDATGIRNKGTFDLAQDYVGAVASVVQLAEELPAELTPADSEKYLALSAGLASLKAALSQYYAQGGSGVRLFGMSALGGRNPLELIYYALEGLHDSVPAPETKDFEFIEDSAFRDSLRLDLSDAASALRNGEWKAATILSGSVIEALLFWELAIHQPTDDATLQSIFKKPLAEWDLHHYLEGAKRLGCLLPATISVADQAKEFRNLIHPGRAQRLKTACDLGTAHVAIGAVDHVARDLAQPVCSRHRKAGD